MIALPGTRATFKYLKEEEAGDGGRLMKTWVVLHEDVPCVLVPVKIAGAEALAYDREKAFAEFKLYVGYLDGIDTRVRAYVGGREFEVRRVSDFDTSGVYLRILVKEITED